MNNVVASGWYNHLKQELKSGTSIEKVSRRSEYWRKSNIDILSDQQEDISELDISKLEGTYLYKPDLTIYGTLWR